jgi:hypothetical protein
MYSFPIVQSPRISSKRLELLEKFLCTYDNYAMYPISKKNNAMYPIPIVFSCVFLVVHQTTHATNSCDLSSCGISRMSWHTYFFNPLIIGFLTRGVTSWKNSCVCMTTMACAYLQISCDFSCGAIKRLILLIDIFFIPAWLQAVMPVYSCTFPIPMFYKSTNKCNTKVVVCPSYYIYRPKKLGVAWNGCLHVSNKLVLLINTEYSTTKLS